MSDGDNGDKSDLKNSALNRRNINNPIQVAQAQTQPLANGAAAS